jgi:hypothetical protein
MRESNNTTSAEEVTALVGIVCPIEMRWKVKKQKGEFGAKKRHGELDRHGSLMST